MTRLLVVGLDGGTEAVVGLPDADLPNLAAVRAEGASAVLRSTVPPITAAAWASMMTGWNPGRHGMYDFRGLAIDKYTRLWGAGQSAAFGEGHEFMTSRRWAGAAFWDRLPEPLRAGVLSVPMTYPAWEIRGDLIAGFPLPDYGRNHSKPAAAGEGLPPLLQGADRIQSMSDEELAAFCQRLIDQQRDAVTRWLEDGAHDVIVCVFQGIDFAQHRLWKYLDRPGHPLRDALLRMYRTTDALIGQARAHMGADGTVVVVSDHGFGPHPRTFVHTDAVLAESGLLSASGGLASASGAAAGALRRAPGLRRTVRRALDHMPDKMKDWAAGQYTGAARVDWASTRAYRIPLYAPAEGVVVNLRGRQEQGAVEPGAEYEAVRDEIIAALEGLRDPETAAAPVQWARRREDVFDGPYVEQAPDVVALFDERYKGQSGVDRSFSTVPQSVLESYSGVHAMDGIFAVAGPGVRAGVDLGVRDIVDVGPTLLALLGEPVPSEADGAAMADALREPASVTVTEGGGRAAGEDEAPALTAEEEATLEASLRSLGYIE